MNTNHVPFEQLPITNRFMFALVFSHKRIAKPFLEALLGVKIFGGFCSLCGGVGRSLSSGFLLFPG